MRDLKRFEQILEQIKDIEIQGATNIAEAGIRAFLINPNAESAKKILSTRPTEPFLQNSIHLLLKSKNPKKTSKKILDYIKKSNKKIARHGSMIIKNDMNIFTHCHSSTVMDILKLAKKKHKQFVVYNTEVQPLLQGRKTATELAKLGIKVIHLPDTAAEDALKKCDLFLFGADAYLKNKIVNKAGTNMLCEIAKLHNIPCYSAGISLKYTKKIKMEMRSGKELWDERNKNIIVINPAFSSLNAKHLTGIISEFGITNYKKFIKLSMQNLKTFENSK